MVQIVDLKQERLKRVREQRKLDPQRLKLVQEISQHHPEWGPLKARIDALRCIPIHPVGSYSPS
jgi:hypothetical protein